MLRFRSSSDCTFGCILLRIKFCMHPVNYILHVSPPAVCDCIRLLQTHPAVRLVSLQRTNRTEYLRNVRCVWRYGLNKEPLAVNSLNLMERGPKFCTAEERVCGTLPNARSEAVGPGPILLAWAGPAQLRSDDLNPKSVGCRRKSMNRARGQEHLDQAY